MEYWQKRYIRENQAFPALAGLLTIDLPNKGLLGCVELRIDAKTGACGGLPDFWVHDAIKKVELIVNGSQVVKSLTGNQILALNQYDRCYADADNLYNVAFDWQREVFLLNLGRIFHDREFVLDLGRVNDPEVRIEYDFTTPAVNINGWTNKLGFPDHEDTAFTCIPHLLRDSDVVPRGYIKTSEVYRFTSAAGHQENMTIPRGPVYMGLYLQSWYMNEGLERNIDHVELNIDNDKIIPFRLNRRDLATTCEREFGLFDFSQIINGTNGQEYPSPIESGKMWEQNILGADVIGSEGVLWANYMTIGGLLISTYGAAVGDYTRYYHFRGRYPFSVMKLPHLDDLNDRTWINSAELGDFWVRVEEDDGAGTHAIFKLLADEVVTTYLS